MPTKLPTIRDVAREAGVSPATVSNVLAGRRAVRPDSEARVRAAAAALGYAVDRAASQLRSGRTRIVAVLVPSLENPFFTSIVAAVERHLQADGYDLVVASSNDDETIEQARLRALMSWRPSGMIIVPCTDSFANGVILRTVGTPYVVIDRVDGDHGADTVSADNENAGRAAAEHLVELGHRRLLVVASSLKLANIRTRCRGIESVLRAASLPPPALLEVGLDQDTNAARLRSWLKTNERPTAIIALTNFATLGVLASLSQFAIKIPHDVSLVGFDDYAWMRAAAPSITAVRQPVDTMGAAAWACLQRRIEGGTEEPYRHSLACDLIVRASTARLGASPAHKGDTLVARDPVKLRRPRRTKHGG